MTGDIGLAGELTKQFELLLGSLDSIRAISPPSSHVLLQAPMERSSTRESIRLARKSISTCRMQVAGLSQILDQILSMCSNLDQDLHTCINPINSLPTELIQHIVGFAVESPSNCRLILDLACVCKTWNTAIFTLSELFVAPDLVKWPVEFVQKWLSRSAFRPFSCDLSQTPESHLLLPMFVQIVPQFYSRIRALHVQLSKDFERFTAIWVGVQTPELEQLTVKSHSAYEDELDLSKALLPKLKTLYVPSLRVIVPEATPFLQNFGCRMYCTEDFGALSFAVNNSKSLRHIALFASPSELVEVADQALQEVTLLAPQIESLCLYGYIGSDAENMEPYLLVLSTLSIHTLELVRMNLDTYSLAVQTMSIRKSSEIKTLFLRPHDDVGFRLPSRKLEDYFEALSGEQSLSGGLDFLPKLESIIIQKSPTVRNDLTINVDEVGRILAPRMGVLKRLIFPKTLDPASDPKGDTQEEGPASAMVLRLTPVQVQYLTRFGRPDQHVSSIEVGFSYEADRHGLDMDVRKIYHKD